MARVLVPIGRTPRARVCVVCGSIDGVTIEPIGVRSRVWWILTFMAIAVCGLPGICVAWLMLDLGETTVLIPFTAACLRTWRRVRVASHVVVVLIGAIPTLGMIVSVCVGAPDIFLKACGTAFVLILFPVALRFGPPALGPVFHGRREGTLGDALVVEFPNAEAAAALTREGWE